MEVFVGGILRHTRFLGAQGVIQRGDFNSVILHSFVVAFVEDIDKCIPNHQCSAEDNPWVLLVDFLNNTGID